MAAPKAKSKPKSKSKPTGKRPGEISFKAPRGFNPKGKKIVKAFHLKKLGKLRSEKELKKILGEAAKRKVGFIVLNAPFKFRPEANS